MFQKNSEILILNSKHCDALEFFKMSNELTNMWNKMTEAKAGVKKDRLKKECACLGCGHCGVASIFFPIRCI